MSLYKLSALVVLIPLWSSAITFEQRATCEDPVPGTTDETFAPSFVSVIASQDNQSRYIIGSAQWDHPYYFLYYTKRIGGSPYGFELETHFYNYDDAAATGLGPAYMRGWACEEENSLAGVICQGSPTGLAFCTLPACYQDTQALSDKNSLGEYKQPQLAFGSYDGSMLQLAYRYDYGARGATGRGNRSATKINFQPTRPLVPGIRSVINQFACKFSNGAVYDTELVPMGVNGLTFDRVYSPLCMRIYYKNQGISKRYEFCSPP
jgi:hypothetical protein